LVSKSRNNSHSPIAIGAGIAAAVALTIGIYSLQGLITSTSESQWVQTRSRWKTLAGDSTYINPVAISSDGKTLASGSEDGAIKLWDLQKNKQSPPHLWVRCSVGTNNSAVSLSLELQYIFELSNWKHFLL
jgi:WD40 repeat protein